MDPVTIVATAIAVGAAAGVSEGAKQSVIDAYAALKDLLARRYRDVDLTQVETTPGAAAERESLAGILQARGAAEDDELLFAARDLIGAVRAGAAADSIVGVDLEAVEAAALRISNVTATGTGVRVRGGRFSGDIDIANIGAGPGDSTHPD